MHLTTVLTSGEGVNLLIPETSDGLLTSSAAQVVQLGRHLED